MSTPLVPPGCSCCAATTPSLCHRFCHLLTVHHLLTVSMPAGAAQSVADLALRSPCASLAQPRQERTKPPLLPLHCTATLPGDNPQHTLALRATREPGVFCAALTSQWREVWNFWKVLPSQEPLTPMGPPHHNATCLKFTVSCSENPSTLSTVNVKY